MNELKIEHLEAWYKTNFEDKLQGKRIVFNDIAPLIRDLNASVFKKELLGSSEGGTDIFKLSLGTGAKKILIWSQMHGNESTGTKAVFDLFNFFNKENEFEVVKQHILSACTLIFVPMLNPDGSDAFTRVNKHAIDLNRDAVDLKAKESKLLRGLLDSFSPEFCFNLHDQRTIFNVENTKNPATISFLAPSEEVERKLTKGRIETMGVIVAMNSFLSQVIPNHIGRYTDEFYPTATGDNFQKLGHNTILIEAGHYYDDYDRDVVRKFNFFTLLEGLRFIASTGDYSDYKPYFEIPNNAKMCYDIIYRNVMNTKGEVEDVAYQFEYKVKNGSLESFTTEVDRGDLSAFTAHKDYDFEKKKLFDK